MLAETLVRDLLAFRQERDWEQFHTPKNLAIAIAVEADELLEQFQWTRDGNASSEPEDRVALRHELADVAILLTYLAHDLGVDLDEAVRDKLRLNAERYPAGENRGRVRKHGR